jgi:hypothetical protein
VTAPTLPLGFPLLREAGEGDQLAGLAALERVALEQAAARMGPSSPVPRGPRSVGAWPRRLRLAIPLLLSAVLCLSLGSGPARSAGIARYLAPVCGRAWVPVNLGQGNYVNVYNEPDGGSCVRVQDGRDGNLSWYVPYRDSTGRWQDPVASWGLLWGKNPCYDGKSGLGRTSRCELADPVQVKHDGHPLASVTYWPHLRGGNVSFDIWFNREFIPRSRYAGFGQPDGAEVMIWLAHPGAYASFNGGYAKILGR